MVMEENSEQRTCMEFGNLKEKWTNYVRSNQNIAAGIVAVLAALIIWMVLFQTPRPGVMDFGAYTQILYDMGLEWTQTDLDNSSELQFVKIIERYNIVDLSVIKLLQIEPTQTLIYPVTFLSVICKLMGITFSTMYLAILLSLITIGCIYSITKSLYCVFKEFAVVIGISLCVVLLCGNHIIYFNSLYDDGVFLVSVLFYLAILLNIIIVKKNNGISSMVQLLIASLLLLNASETGIFILPVIIVSLTWMFLYCKPKREKIVAYILICLLLFIFVMSASVRYAVKHENVYHKTNLYHAIFTGVLPNAEDPSKALEELGIAEELEGDSGKSIYLLKDEYLIDPNSNEAEEAIFNKVNYYELFKFYASHPQIYISILKKTAESSISIDSSKFLYNNIIRKNNEGQLSIERFVWWQWVRAWIVPSSLLSYAFFVCLVSIAISIYIYIGRKDKRKVSMGICFFIFILFAIFEFIFVCASSGFAEVNTKIHYFIYFLDLIMVGLFSFIIYSACKLIGFLKIKDLSMINKELEYRNIIDEQEMLNIRNPVLTFGKRRAIKIKAVFIKKVLSYPNRGAILVTGIGAIILLLVLFCPRIGAYNNGDFHRMMTAMNVQYTAEDLENPNELAMTKVIENYDWVENYEYSKIMFYDADVTQSWMSLVIKLIDNVVDLKFSTIYVTILYCVLLIISFFVIMKNMFQQFGYKWFWMALIFIIILFDRDNLGWLNSFYGEGPAFIGFIMIIASSLYIINNKENPSLSSFILLLFSINFFAGSKAQFTVTAPVLLLWVFILGIFHKPEKKWKSILLYPVLIFASCFIMVGSYNIYKTNSDNLSKDTVYQSIFYGILMISDDKEGDLLELGLDPVLAVDAGKHAYLDKSEYYCPPRTEMSDEMIYSKVNTFTVLSFYLKHPDKLLIMMDVAAKASAEKMSDWVLYVGQKATSNHDTVKKFNIWRELRPHLVANRFWELILIYGLVLFLSLRILLKKECSRKDKLLICLYLVIAGIGIIEFPLTVIGNGFADNTKQLYLFRLSYDITVFMGLFLLIPWFRNMIHKITIKMLEWEKFEKKNDN